MCNFTLIFIFKSNDMPDFGIIPRYMYRCSDFLNQFTNKNYVLNVYQIYISVELYKQPMVVDGQKGLTRLRNTIETKRFFGCFHNLNFVGLLSFTFFYLHFSVIYMFKLQQLLTSLVSIHCLATPQVFPVPTTQNYKLISIRSKTLKINLFKHVEVKIWYTRT